MRSRSYEQERRVAALWLAVTEAICAAMQDQDVSKAELAKRVGISRRRCLRLLSGREDITLRVLARIADELGLRPEFVMNPEISEEVKTNG